MPLAFAFAGAAARAPCERIFSFIYFDYCHLFSLIFTPFFHYYAAASPLRCCIISPIIFITPLMMLLIHSIYSSFIFDFHFHCFHFIYFAERAMDMAGAIIFDAAFAIIFRWRAFDTFTLMMPCHYFRRCRHFRFLHAAAIISPLHASFRAMTALRCLRYVMPFCRRRAASRAAARGARHARFYARRAAPCARMPIACRARADCAARCAVPCARRCAPPTRRGVAACRRKIFSAPWRAQRPPFAALRASSRRSFC